jgi:hypothetical protein
MMRLALRIFGIVVGILALAILGFGGWIVVARQDALQLASAVTAKTVCANVFMAGRDVDAIVQADLLSLGYQVFHLMKIDVEAFSDSLPNVTRNISRDGAAPASRTINPGSAPPRSRFRPGQARTRFGRPARRWNCPRTRACRRR